ncbi:hypothetical protein [Methylotuvimicrobium sp. KM1]|uniref:hypothetical protein n=1 Tax=Methylotuvimicrobium sp. KM1 TaxID=3377707 RepID=UPI003850B73F
MPRTLRIFIASHQNDIIPQQTSLSEKIMQALTDRELYQALEYAKSIDETTGRGIMADFQTDQTMLAQMLFGIFPGIIAEQNQDMAHLFMDLCFDLLCVFQKAFGPLPAQNELDIDWLQKQAMLLDTELQAVKKNQDMDEKIRNSLQQRMISRTHDETPQSGLIAFMNAAVDDYASENPSRVPATQITQALILVAIRLFNNLYTHARKS